jgi:uncharacterized protein (TIGR03083 family)
MTTHTVVPVSTIPRIGHQEAMSITAEENTRFHRLLLQVEPDQWHLPTDCTRWDVRDIAVHVIATAEAAASPLEFGRQMRAGRTLTAEIGGAHWVDGLNEAQMRARAQLAPPELPGLWATSAARGLRARERMPRPVRALPLIRLQPKMWKPLSFLFDMGFTRDTWMHRIDISRALGRPVPATAEHDGRIVADIVAEWSTTHTDPFTLRLTGPAGGTYSRSSEPAGETVTIDAIDLCRILSGRGAPTGIMRHPFPL